MAREAGRTSLGYGPCRDRTCDLGIKSPSEQTPRRLWEQPGPLEIAPVEEEAERRKDAALESGGQEQTPLLSSERPRPGRRV